MNIALWIVQVVLVVLFMFTGVAKFLMPADEMAKNLPPFLSVGFIYFIGICEILGSVGLVLPWALNIRPRLTPLAAVLLLVIVVGATAVTAMSELSLAIFPAVVAVLCAFVAWGRNRTNR